MIGASQAENTISNFLATYISEDYYLAAVPISVIRAAKHIYNTFRFLCPFHFFIVVSQECATT